jgi:hypothetical protein
MGLAYGWPARGASSILSTATHRSQGAARWYVRALWSGASGNAVSGWSFASVQKSRVNGPKNPSTSFRLTFSVRAGQKGPAFGRNRLPKGVTPLELINFRSKYVKAFRPRAGRRASAEAGIGQTPMWIGAVTERVMDKLGSGKSDVGSEGGSKNESAPTDEIPI